MVNCSYGWSCQLSQIGKAVITNTANWPKARILAKGGLPAYIDLYRNTSDQRAFYVTYIGQGIKLFNQQTSGDTIPAEYISRELELNVTADRLTSVII